MIIELTKRQQEILALVKKTGSITGEQIADHFNVTRATLRADLSILMMAGFIDARPRVGYYYTGNKSNQFFTQKLNKIVVKDYKSPPAVIKEKVSVYDAICAMFLEDVGSLFVIKEDGTLLGVVSRKDLLKSAIGQQNLQEVPISIVMTRMPNIVTCELEDSLYDVAKKLIHNQIDSIPVIKDVGTPDKPRYEVVGRITKTVITKAYVELGQEEPV
jgi:CBS domain-containing protein/biotin operon repressor